MSLKNLPAIAKYLQEGYFKLNARGLITACNDAACRLTGCSRETLAGLPFHLLFEDGDGIIAALEQIISSKEVKELTLVLAQAVPRTGENGGQGDTGVAGGSKGPEIPGAAPVRCGRVTLVPGDEGLCALLVVDEKEERPETGVVARLDELTGAYTRRCFFEALQRLELKGNHPISLIVADLDGLKLINDVLGFPQGDFLLRECARLLRLSLPRQGFVARTGSDEFVAVLPATNEKSGQKVVKKIQSNIKNFQRRQKMPPLSVSLGLYVAVDAGESLEQAYKKAALAMYREKVCRSAEVRKFIASTLLDFLEARDYLADGHAETLEKYCLALGRRVGLSGRRLKNLSLLARVHDLGKVAIPDYIIFKKGPLSRAEWEQIRTHPEKGYYIASSTADLAPVAGLILQHHERWDGSGYPLGIRGEEIPLECRILAVVDAYDTMTRQRPFSPAKTKEEAIAELLRCSGTQFDPRLVEEFLLLLLEE